MVKIDVDAVLHGSSPPHALKPSVDSEIELAMETSKESNYIKERFFLQRTKSKNPTLSKLCSQVCYSSVVKEDLVSASIDTSDTAPTQLIVVLTAPVDAEQVLRICSTWTSRCSLELQVWIVASLSL